MPRSSNGSLTADPLLTVERVRLTFFVVRHIVGVALFVWLTFASFRLNAVPLGYLFLVLTPVYAGFAVFSGRSLWNRMRYLERRRAAAAALRAGETR